MDSYIIDQVNHFTLKKHHLTNDTKSNDISKITKDIFGLHATGATTPFLSLFSRSKNFLKDNLIEELLIKKTLVKIRCVRKTIYIIPIEIFPAVFSATRSMVDLISRRHYKFLGVTEQQYEETSKKILNIIQGQGMTTKEIKQELGTDLNVSPIVNLMCDRGLLMRGMSRKGWKSNIHTYYRFEEFFPDVNLKKYNEIKAKEFVIRQYLAAFGPVTFNDIVWWTGFPKNQIKSIVEVLKDELMHIEISDMNDDFITLCSDKQLLSNLKSPNEHIVNILPSLDPYIMGYRDRDRYLNLKDFNMIFDRSGNATSTILVDGNIIGIWDFIEPYIKIYLLKNVKKDILKEIQTKAKNLGTFITGKEVEIKECKSMIPLPQRTAGSFMSPLKDS